MSKSAIVKEFEIKAGNSKQKLIEEIEENIKKTEIEQESQIKSLKNEIKGMKKTLEESQMMFEAKAKKNKEKYEKRIFDEKTKSKSDILKKHEKLKELNEEKKILDKEVKQFETGFNRIKLSCEEETKNLKNKKKILKKMEMQLESQIKYLKSEKISHLKRDFKELKAKNTQDESDFIHCFKKTQKDCEKQLKHKSELLCKLEKACQIDKSELNELKNLNHNQIFQLDSLIQNTGLKADKYHYKLKKIRPSSIDQFAKSKSSENLQTKLIEFETIKNFNSDLRDRCEKLSNIIFGRSTNID